MIKKTMLCVSAGSCGGRDQIPLTRDCDQPDNGELRILVIGPNTVGKSALCQRFLTGRCNESPPTEATDKQETYKEKLEEVDDEISVLRVTDITTTFPMVQSSGDVQANMKRCIQNCDGFVVVYSVTDRSSWMTSQRLVSYIQHIRKGRDLPIVLVGNKIDAWMERCISREEGQSIAFDLGVSFYESSVRHGTINVNTIFHDVVRQIRSVRLRTEYIRQQQLLSPSPSRRSTNFARGVLSRLSLRSAKARLREDTDSSTD